MVPHRRQNRTRSASTCPISSWRRSRPPSPSERHPSASGFLGRERFRPYALAVSHVDRGSSRCACLTGIAVGLGCSTGLPASSSAAAVVTVGTVVGLGSPNPEAWMLRGLLWSAGVWAAVTTILATDVGIVNGTHCCRGVGHRLRRRLAAGAQGTGWLNGSRRGHGRRPLALRRSTSAAEATTSGSWTAGWSTMTTTRRRTKWNRGPCSGHSYGCGCDLRTAGTATTNTSSENPGATFHGARCNAGLSLLGIGPADGRRDRPDRRPEIHRLSTHLRRCPALHRAGRFVVSGVGGRR